MQRYEWPRWPTHRRVAAVFVVWGLGAVAPGADDSDRDGLPDGEDACPRVTYDPAFDWTDCGPMDVDPSNDCYPECKARERVVDLLLNDGAFITHIGVAVVKDGEVHFADAFQYVGQGEFEHNPTGIHRLYRVGSTSKPIVAVAAKIMEERGELSLSDWVNDEDGTQILENGERTLGHLLSHRGAFGLDVGAIHLFCYPADLGAFWREPDDLVSPHFDSDRYGNLGGGFEYSAFNYSLAGAYISQRAGETFERVIQTRVLDASQMCTATLDNARAVTTVIGNEPGVSQSAAMHVGPYINLVSPDDPLCEDNFYNSDDVYGDPYSWQYYYLDEASGEARDPAGGVIASVVDMAHFASALLESYNTPDGLLSQQGIRDLWGATSDLGCAPNCPYQPYYGVGFFTDSLPDAPVHEVEHGGSRAGYASAFVLRPEANLAVCVLANADASTVAMSDLAKAILDDFEGFVHGGDLDGDGDADADDFFAYLDAFADGILDVCDIDGDGDCDARDFFGYLDLFAQGC